MNENSPGGVTSGSGGAHSGNAAHLFHSMAGLGMMGLPMNPMVGANSTQIAQTLMLQQLIAGGGGLGGLGGLGGGGAGDLNLATSLPPIANLNMPMTSLPLDVATAVVPSAAAATADGGTLPTGDEANATGGGSATAAVQEEEQPKGDANEMSDFLEMQKLAGRA